MIGVGLIEALGTGVGHLNADTDADAQIGGGHLAMLGWLGFGNGLPLLVWLVSFLSCFALIGVALQQASTLVFGAPLDAMAATGATIIPGLAVNSFAARSIARIFPSYETSIISAEDLVMRRGVILEGIAKRGHPARAKVVDQHKQAHFVMVEPQYDNEFIETGQTALLVRKDGNVFFGIPDIDTALSPVH
jgi:hypothetical protein